MNKKLLDQNRAARATSASAQAAGGLRRRAKCLLLPLLLCALLPLSLRAQNLNISGTVRDGNNEPVAGASVVIKGATMGVTTDASGSYTISAPADATLVFSFLGLATKEEAVAGRGRVDVTLESSDQAIDEVVVVGFGTQRKVNLTGAVGVTTAREIENRPVQLASQVLQGLVPGLTITQNNGTLDSKPSISIRGKGTLNSEVSSSPLVLIDGIESDINALNPQDIESVSVLKDAAASSIYGSKAPFGVILITTKKGTAGKTTVSYNNNFRFNSPVLLPEFMDSYTFALYFDDACMNTPGWGTHINDSWLQGIKDFQEGKTTVAAIPKPNGRWEDGFDPAGIYGTATNVGGLDNRDYYQELYRDYAFSQEHNLSLSGGTDKVTYYTSFGFLGQNGLMVYNQDSYNRFSATGKVSYEVNPWITLSYNHRFVRDDYTRPSGLTNSLFQDIGRQCWPFIPLYDGNGNLFEWKALDLRDGGNDSAVTDNSYQQALLLFEPVKNWKTTVDVSYAIKNYNRHWDSFPLYQYDVDNNPYVQDAKSGGNVHEENTKEDLLGLNIYSEYSFSFAEKNHLKAMVGFQEQQMAQRLFGLQRNGVISPSYPEVDLTTGADQNGVEVVPSTNGSRNRWSNMGGFGRLNYDYDGKYLLEANLRYDASSRFREGRRTVWSPSVSAGWNVAHESFFEPLSSIVSVLKVRGSYGQLANMNTTGWYPTYSNLGLYSSYGNWLQGSAKPNIATSPGTVENPYLTWEKIVSVNGGLDFALLKSRLTGSFDYYVRTTNDMLGPAPQLPVVLGVNPKKANDTQLQDYGFEFQIEWRDRLQNGLGYGVRLLLADYQTKVLKYPSNKTGKITDYYDGKMLGEIWGYTTVGIAKTQAEMDAHLATVGGQDAIHSSWQAGDIMYASVDGVGGVSPGGRTLDDHGDLTVIGNSTPRYQFGIDLTAEWKGFDFRAFFQGVGKRDYWQGSYFFWGATSGGNDEVADNNGGMWWSTGFTTHADYFRDSESWSVQQGYLSENLDAYYPRPYFGGDGGGKNRKAQTRYLQDASYIRLKNLQIGYTLPQAWAQKVSVSKLRIFFSGENLWTATAMSDAFDPETIDGGWGGSVYPISKVISFGLNINF
ncbi:MAG: TonB-dependent receptor [Prevotellaceae bacterium]|jgi:TonB-linked SusC/RagA family outer membrane protein|nr:TonB-dependent receptor [Prevotellaceae bacterium]